MQFTNSLEYFAKRCKFCLHCSCHKQKTYRLSVYHVLKWDEAQGSHIGSNTRDTLDDTNMSSPFRPGNQSASHVFPSHPSRISKISCKNKRNQFLVLFKNEMGKLSVQHLRTQRIRKNCLRSCFDTVRLVCKKFLVTVAHSRHIRAIQLTPSVVRTCLERLGDVRALVLQRTVHAQNFARHFFLLKAFNKIVPENKHVYIHVCQFCVLCQYAFRVVTCFAEVGDM